MRTKILFADDDQLVRRIYGEKLAEAGFDVALAEDGVAAMRKMLEFQPDLVVLDLLMPKMTGADVLKFIRENPKLKSTRVVVFSNSFLAALVEQVGASGVEGSLPKSTATPAQLIETIHRVLASPVVTINQSVPAKTPKDASVTPPAAPAVPQPKPETPRGETATATQDRQFRTRIQRDFVQYLPRVAVDIRRFSGELLDASEPAIEHRRVEDLSRKVGFLTQMASMAGCADLAQLSSALELLLFHLHEKQMPISDSARHTIATAVAFLMDNLESFNPGPTNTADATVLVVDDDAVSNRATVHALVHAKVRTASSTDPTVALEALRTDPYELILLDVEMPSMSGVELCAQIRDIEIHKRTPVIFLTGHTDLKTRAHAILSGGNDFISKPILPIELTVKVITQILKSRFAKQGAVRTESPG